MQFYQTQMSKLFLMALTFLTTSVYAGNTFNLHKVALQDSNIEVFNLDNTKKIVLTFDDGPGRGTEQILNTLKKYNIKATFFALGKQIIKHPEITRRIVSEGHTLANHSYSHDMLTNNIYADDKSLLLKELIATHEQIKKYVHPGKQQFYFRAPYGSWLQNVSNVLNQNSEIRKYIGPVCWDVGRNIEYNNGQIVNAADWECWNKKNNLSPEQCAYGYYNKIQEIGGGVVLMHDIHQKTADMVDKLIPALLAKGYEFIDLPQLTILNRYKNALDVVPKITEKPGYSMYNGRCLMTRSAPTTSY